MSSNTQRLQSFPDVSIWSTSTQMAGTDHERKEYFMTLKDGDKTIQFSLQVHADGTIVAIPYVPIDFDYTDYDHYSDEDDEGYIAEECLDDE